MSENQLSPRPPSADDSGDRKFPSLGSFQRLSAPPRMLSRLIWLRLSLSQIRWGLALFCGFGAIAIFIGLGFVLFAGLAQFDDAESFWVSSALGGLLLLVGVCIWSVVAAVLISRSRQVASVFRWGEPVEGRITQVMDRSMGKYQPYLDSLKQMTRFQNETGFAGSGMVQSRLSNSLKNWPVKILVTDLHGQDQELDARMDMGFRLTNAVEDSRVALLVNRRPNPTRCVALEQFPWLSISDSGDPTSAVSQFPHALLRALLVVVPTYCVAAFGVRFELAQPFGGEDGLGVPVILGAFIVLLFTVTHGIGPIFFYRIFMGILEIFSRTQKTAADDGVRLNPIPPHTFRFFRFYVGLSMAFWYGIPIIFLGALTGWMSLGWAFLHILLAGRGHRRWVFLEHGATAMALSLFVVCFSGNNLFPVGMMVGLFQALLLTLVEWKGKRLWTKAEPDAAKP